MKHIVWVVSFACCVAGAPLASAQQGLGAEFAAAKAQFEARVKTEAQQPFEAAIADLNVKYSASLDRALESAQKGGRLDDAVALKAEKETIALGRGVPIKDDDKTPAALKQLRDAYRAAVARLDVDRAKRLQPLQVTFIRSLDTLISRLTSGGKLDEAIAVKKYRDGMNAPVPPPAVVGLLSGAGAGLGTSAKHVLATTEQLLAKPWQMSSIKKKAVWTFTPDKSMRSTSGFKAAWSIKGKTLYLDWGKNDITQYSLELQPSTGDLILKGMDSDGKFNDVILIQPAK